MHIIFGVVGQFVVEHGGQIDHIKAARGNVGRHQQLNLALLKALQGSDAFHLRLVAVDDGRRHAALLQLPADLVRRHLGAGKHNGLRQTPLLHDAQQGVQFLGLGDAIAHLFNGLGRRIAPRHLDSLRLMQKLAGETQDVVAKGRRKK